MTFDHRFRPLASLWRLCYNKLERDAGMAVQERRLDSNGKEMRFVAHLGSAGGGSHVVAHGHSGGAGELLIIEDGDRLDASHIISQQGHHRCGAFRASGKGKAAGSGRRARRQRHALDVGIQRAGRQLDLHGVLVLGHSRHIKVLGRGEGTGLAVEDFAVVEQREEVQIGLVGGVGDLDRLAGVNARLRQSGPAVVDVDLFAVDGEARLGGVLQTRTLAVRTLEGDVGNVNDVAARLPQQIGCDDSKPPFIFTR